MSGSESNMNESIAKAKLVRDLSKDYDRVMSDVHVGGSRIRELGGAPKGIILDIVGVNRDGRATIYEVKHNYTAVMVGQALGQLLAYSMLLHDDEIFEVFKQRVEEETGIEIKQDDVSFIAAIIATEDYPDTGIGAQMIPNVTISKGVTLWVVREDELSE